MDNSTLLTELIQQGIIQEPQASKLQGEMSYLKDQIDKVIFERRLADSYKVAEIKASLLNVPFKKIDITNINENILAIIPEDTARSYKVIPIEKKADMLIVGMINPDDVRAQDALRFIAKKEVVNLGVYLIAWADFELVSKKYSPYQSQVDEAVKAVASKYGDNANMGSQRIVQLDEGVSVSEEAPVIKIVASTLQEAIDQKASDIHIEPQRTKLRIRFRIDGDLKEVASFPAQLHQPLVSRVKILSELKIDENRIPQDGRFRTILSGRDIDFRVATFPTPAGEKVVLRILDPTVGLKGLEQLGLSPHNMSLVDKGIKKPFGMILISGPTGSGKTTTLYGILQLLNKEGVNIVSLEDPVEYYIEGLNQSQVRPEIGYSFASGLRQILRQDPDIIMVGEIRDAETAGLAIHAALTGHIVLSTIHTNNAVAVVSRLLDLGAQKFLLSSALNLMAAQRLVRRLCQDCKEAVEPTADVLKEIVEALKDMPSEVLKNVKKPYKIYKAQGCAKCNYKGFIGRVAIFEVFQMTTNLADELSSSNFSGSNILKEARRQGMLTLRQDGILKSLLGEVIIEEVLRDTEASIIKDEVVKNEEVIKNTLVS